MHGHPQVAEIGGHRTCLYPIFHPAAALYTPSMLTTLKEDFQRLPELLSHAVPQTEPAAAPPAAERPAWLSPQRRTVADALSPAPEPAQADLLTQAPADPPAPDADPPAAGPDEIMSAPSGDEQLVVAEVQPAPSGDDEPPAADPDPVADPPAPAAAPDPAPPADVEPAPEAPAGETPASPGKPEQLGLF